MKLKQRPCGQRGFALLIVLWTLVFITFLLTQIMASGRGALVLAGNLRAAAEERAAADGAINVAMFQLLDPAAGHWVASGAAGDDTHVVPVGGLPVMVQVRSLAGLVNPNLASQALLGGLLQAVDVPPGQAGALAAAIIAWRGPPASKAAGVATLAAYRAAGVTKAPAAEPFAALGDLNDVLGMTPRIYAALAPHLSLFQLGNPDPARAGPVVARAIMLAAGPAGGGYMGAPVDEITACVPPRLCRVAVVSLPGANALKPFRVLDLRNGY